MLSHMSMGGKFGTTPAPRPAEVYRAQQDKGEGWCSEMFPGFPHQGLKPVHTSAKASLDYSRLLVKKSIQLPLS